ncbi:MAG: hypothetical protein HY812_06265 [Planctomycetes bacterium]|nr:hypothetical protein [Planctomycetota bacterium]
MSRSSLFAAAAALFSSVACAQTTVEIRSPLFVEPLAGPVVVDVVATEIDVAGDELTIKQGETDVTSAVVQSSSVVVAVDANGDLVYERFVHRYWLDLSSLAFDTTALVLAAQVWNNGVESLILRGMAITPPVTLGTGDTTWVTAVDGNVVSFYLRIEGATVLDRVTTVLKNGVDVTAAAIVTEAVVWDETREGFIHDRMYRIDVDLPSIGFTTVGDSLELRCDIWFPSGLYQWWVSHPVVETDPQVDLTKEECIANCAAAFIAAVGASKAGGETTISNPDAVAGAADALDTCLQNCGMSSGNATVTAGGLTVMVGFGTVSGSADLVVALGADGTGTSAGGNATASNDLPGGAAVANAGDGAPAGTNPGGTKGGDAKATSKGGDAIALGGEGGDGGTAGGSGGHAEVENKVGGKTAIAQGGEGGNPGGQNEVGGSGGNAKGNAGTEGAHAGGGLCSPGYHGGGAKVTVAGGESSGKGGMPIAN